MRLDQSADWSNLRDPSEVIMQERTDVAMEDVAGAAEIESTADDLNHIANAMADIQVIGNRY